MPSCWTTTSSSVPPITSPPVTASIARPPSVNMWPSGLGPSRARALLGVNDLETLRIPTDANSELYRLWKHWRSRVWAEATERFRAALREVKPNIVVMANAQPLYGDWTLASELQLKNEDATLTESRGMDIAGMSKKMLLCQALGRGRPVFSNPDTWQGDFTQCMKATYADGVFHDPTPPQSPETIRTQCAVGLAHGVNPWVVFVGLSDPTPSARAVARQMRLAKRWQEESAGAQPYTNVVSIFSTRQRDYLAGGERSLLPPHLEQLRKAQIPTEPLCDRDLPTFTLGPHRCGDRRRHGLSERPGGAHARRLDQTRRDTPGHARCGNVRRGGQKTAVLVVGRFARRCAQRHASGGLWPSGLACRRLGLRPGIAAVT